MTRARLIKDLYDYRSTCARIDMLSLRVKRAEQWLDMHGDAFIAGTQLSGRTISDMPIARGMPSSPTEKTAIRLMDATLEGLDAAELEQAARELCRLREDKAMLDILLGALKERERFVITAHLIDGMSWRETGRRYAREYGDELTEGAMQAVMRKGIDRMMEVDRASQ